MGQGDPGGQQSVYGLGLGVGCGPDLGLDLVKLALSVGDDILPHPTDWPDLDALSIPCRLGIIERPLGDLDGGRYPFRAVCVPKIRFRIDAGNGRGKLPTRWSSCSN